MNIGRRAVVAGLAGLGAPNIAQAGPRIGRPAPDFKATTFGGREVTLADLSGNVILLNFWATWCAPCRVELPILETAFRSYNKYGFQVLAIATENSLPESKLRPLASKLTIPFVKKMKGPYRELDAVPTNYIIDRSGKVVYAKAGSFTVDGLLKVLLPLLNEPIPAAPAPDGQATPDPA